MNPNTGEIFHGDDDFIREFEEREGIKLIPIPREKLSEVENMNEVQRKAWAKQERKRALRLARRNG